MKLGPLPVEVTVDTDESAITLRHGKHEIDLEVEDPLAVLMELGLLLVAPVAAAPAKKPRARRKRASKPKPATAAGAGKTRCARRGCDKTFKPRDTPGRPKRFCGKDCARKARAAELDAALDRKPVEIPESASGMRERAKSA